MHPKTPIWLSAGALAVAAVLAGLPARAQTTPPLSFADAQWIWCAPDGGTTDMDFPAGAHCFRAAFQVPADFTVKTAEIVLTADNLYTLYVNGQLTGVSDANPNFWNRPKRFDLVKLIVPGRNVIAIEGVNTIPGPAGLIVKLAVTATDGRQLTLASDATWKCAERETAGWEKADFDDQNWRAVQVVAGYGAPPWGKVAVPGQLAGAQTPAERQAARKALAQQKNAARQAARQQALAGQNIGVKEITPPTDYPWPDAVAFVGDDCSLYRPPGGTGTSYDSLSVTIFNPRHSRAFPEHDLPAPMKVGRKLYALKPARPGVAPAVLLDAGGGAIGSPSVAFDGRSILVSMTKAGGAFFHIYRVSADGGAPQQLTDGPFHDIDPVEMPDGRVVFTSTRIGYFEEYHNPPSRALFVMRADGQDIKPLTHTFVFDNEPEILADGRILFIRTDNFFDRGKVETLLHAVHPDGTEGYTEFGLEMGPEYGGRLRSFNVGSPAPMPDGRVAFVSGPGITVAWPGALPQHQQNLRFEAGDVAALPDGRLLCTTATRQPIPAGSRRAVDTVYKTIGVVDPQTGALARLYTSSNAPLHSPVHLGPRVKPPTVVEKVDRRQAGTPGATGFLFCQDARFTLNTTAGWPHVRAIRVLAGKGLTVRSSHSYIVHAGSEVVELGTVPLAPDGSFYVEVPADTAIAFQAVDAEGRSELNEMSWIYVRPGETRGCVGCHQPRQVTPPHPSAVTLATRAKPLRLLGEGDPHRFRGNNAAVTGMMEMQFDRYREVASLNRHAADDGALSDAALLVKQLASDESGARITAAQRLAIFRDRAAAPALARQLSDTDREARVAAAVALAACGTRQSVPDLLKALEDADPLVAQAAALALENLSGRTMPFDPFARSAERARQAQAWRAWFAANPPEQIAQGLVKQLGDANRDVVRRAAVALGHWGAGAEALREYVARERANNPYPEWRRTHQGDGAMFNSLSPANPRTLQEAVRALGYLRDAESVPMLAETLRQHCVPASGNLFLAEAAAEALGRIGTAEAQAALLQTFAALRDYPEHTLWYGDHPALIACHAAPIHYFIMEALDQLRATNAAAIVPHVIRSVPTDPDRALFPYNDDYENLAGRIIRRSGAEAAVVETCLAILKDPQGQSVKEIEAAIAATHQAWGGKPDRENRAAQILSLACRDRRYEPRVRAALDRYRTLTNSIPRVFDTGIPVVNKLPVKHWVCFFLARSLGNLRAPESAHALIAALEQSAPEAAAGRPDPLGPGVLFLHDDLTPCWRAAVAWALGEIGDARAESVLTRIVTDLENAPDTRHAAAEALGKVANRASLPALQQLAATYPEVSTRLALLRACNSLEKPRSR